MYIYACIITYAGLCPLYWYIRRPMPMTMNIIHTPYTKVVLWFIVSAEAPDPLVLSVIFLGKSNSRSTNCGIAGAPSIAVFPSNCSQCSNVTTWHIFIAFFWPPSLWSSHFSLSHCSCEIMGQSSIFHPGKVVFKDYCFFASRLAVFQMWPVTEYLVQLLDCAGKAKVLHYSLNLQCDSGHMWLQFCLRSQS